MAGIISSSKERDHPLSSFSNNHAAAASSSSSSSSPIPLSDAEAYLADHGSAPGSFQNDGLLSTPGDSATTSDAEFGFHRSDFRQTPLVGTVENHDRHVFLCYKNPRVWPPHVEAAEFDRVPRLLSAALAARKPDMIKQTRLTICEGHDGPETSNGDVLIFPDMVRYRRLTHFDVDTFVEEVLVKDTEWLPGTPESLTGSYIFVCCHGTRDRRCGVCGPALVTKFKEEVEIRGLQGQVSVSPCSHIGGHKYAGNVIIFCPNASGEVTGHWYGYVTPEDVPILLEQHIGKGEVVGHLWRGQMGMSQEDQKQALVLRLQSNCGIGGDNSSKEPAQAISRDGNGSKVDMAGCCQGSRNSSCCQNPSLEGIRANDPMIETIMTTGKKNDRDEIGSKGTCTRKPCSMPTWMESWEREDTYAALAVAWAVASVAVAYICYKNLD